jgi:hypothetical protein
MNTQLNYEIAKQRIADLARVGAHRRIANEMRAGQFNPSPKNERAGGALAGTVSKLRGGRTSHDAARMARGVRQSTVRCVPPGNGPRDLKASR